MLRNTSQKKMRVSFDLDEVLFVNPATHSTERELPFPFRLIFKERLRAGAPELIRRMRREGFEVWIYTSSFRTAAYIRRFFKCYGVRLDGIVNGQRHQEEIQRNKKESMPTKLPNRYQISLHIDDESIVATYGRAYGFEVYQLFEEDAEWAQKIMERLYKIKKLKFDEQ